MQENSIPVPPEAHWRAALAEGRFLLQRDPQSGAVHFPPRLSDPSGPELEWIEASGRATVYSVTVISKRPPEEPANVVLVDLDEGPRMMARVEGMPADEITIGMALDAKVAEGEGGPLVVFHPA